MENTWEQVGNKCLNLANSLLDSETVPTAATVETVGKLVSIAIAIDTLNLQWAVKTRYGERASAGPASVQRGSGS